MKFLFLLFLLGSQSLFAQSNFFNIGNIQIDPAHTAVESTIRGVFADLETKGRNQLNNIEPGNYLKYSADSTIMSGKFVGSDYANNFDLFMVGLGVGVGVNISGSISDVTSGDTELDDTRGAGLQASLIGGLNLGILPFGKNWMEMFRPERFSLLFNFFKYDAEQDDFSADAMSIGAMLRWHAITGQSFAPFNLATWEGLHVHLGFQKSNLDITASEALNLTESDGGFTGSFNSTAVINAEIDTLSIPLEVSSAMRLLNIFTLYGGIGFDLNAGSGKGNASLSQGTVSVSGGGGTSTATATANLGQEQDPESSFSRYFAGLQINAWKLKLLVQYDKEMSGDTHGVGVGLRFAW